MGKLLRVIFIFMPILGTFVQECGPIARAQSTIHPWDGAGLPTVPMASVGSDRQPILSGSIPTLALPGQQIGTLTLMDAIGLALRNSKIVRVSQGGAIAADPFTEYDVRTSRERVLAALADFDSSLAAEIYTSSFNKPPNAFFGPGFVEPNLRDEATVNLGLNKRWYTGAKTSVSFNPEPAYFFLPQGNGSGFNPTYVGELELSARQPLLRGRGREVNGAPIQIRQIQAEQSAWEFKKAMMASLRSITASYWDLYAARIALKSIDDVVPLLEEIVRLQEENYRSEWVIKADVAKAYAQLYDFQQRRSAAQSEVVQFELRLRNLLYLPPDDGWSIVPITNPESSPISIDPEYAASLAINNYPDLVRLRLETKIRELELVVARNGRLPSFDLRTLYRMNGVGEDVAGTLNQMFSAEHSDWLAGFTFSVPLGNRKAQADHRAAEMQLARTTGLFQQEVASAVYRVRDGVRKIEFAYLEYTQAERRRAASAEWLAGSRLRYENPRPGTDTNWLVQSLNEYLFALRFHTEASADAAQVLARYNNALIELEETQGTLLEYHNFELATDPCRQSQTLSDPSLLLKNRNPDNGNLGAPSTDPSTPPPPTFWEPIHAGMLPTQTTNSSVSSPGF